jgi:hypothetical protein
MLEFVISLVTVHFSWEVENASITMDSGITFNGTISHYWFYGYKITEDNKVIFVDKEYVSTMSWMLDK